jgi:hypothetical protein
MDSVKESEYTKIDMSGTMDKIRTACYAYLGSDNIVFKNVLTMMIFLMV